MKLTPIQHPKPITFVLWCSLFAILSLSSGMVTTAAAQENQIGLCIGLASSNMEQQATGGIIWNLSDDVATLYQFETGGGTTEAAARGVIKFKTASNLTAAFILGPGAVIEQTDPSDADKITYAKLATGFALAYRMNPTLSVWTGFDRSDTKAQIPAYKYAFGLILWFN